MFQALQPLLAKRGLVLTLASIEGGRIRITVNPVAKDTDSAVKDVVVPFIAEGSAEELDAELAEKITFYTAQHLSLDESLEAARDEIEAAKREAKEEAAKRTAEARKAGAKGKFVPPAKPAAAADALKPKPEPAQAPGLFAAPEEPAVKAAAIPASAPAPDDGAMNVEDKDPGSTTNTPTQEGINNGSDSQACAA